MLSGVFLVLFGGSLKERRRRISSLILKNGSPVKWRGRFLVNFANTQKMVWGASNFFARGSAALSFHTGSAVPDIM